MRRGRIIGGTGLGLLAALLLASTALAATPRQIYRDYADNGRLDHTYSKADLHRALQDAAVQGYGQPNVVVTLKPAVKEQLQRTSGVAGVQATHTARPQALRAQRSAATLPFTGLDVALIAIGGGGLLLLGGGLRQLGKSRA